MRGKLLAAALLLSSCAPAAQTERPRFAPKINTIERAAVQLPPMRSFAPAAMPRPVSLSNADLARDFLDLTFELESGRALPRFSRFEGPVRVAVRGTAAPTLQTDLTALLNRLRTEAGIAISQTTDPDAEITINAISRRALQRELPEAACFVIPNVSTLAEFRQARKRGQIDWTQVTERRKLAIFVPADVAPQELRDCLHEELAQALGPVNDLYRLSESVFNDDNVHTVLTGYDMLILRAVYDPSLRSGMTRAEVAARLPAIFARLNPAGQSSPARNTAKSPRAWTDAVQTALGPGTAAPRRIQAAQTAVRIATAQGWTDNRRGFSHYILARLNQSNRALARQHFEQADSFFARAPDTQLHRAFTGAQLAADALRRNMPEEALSYTQPHIALAEQAQNATLLATLMLLQAEALDLLGRSEQAQALRLDSLGWARYGFGSGEAVRGKTNEVAALKTSQPG